MTQLTGSEKQIAWATDIRARFIELRAQLMKGCKDPDDPRMKQMVDMLDRFENQSSAAWWIDNRDSWTTPKELAGAIISEILGKSGYLNPVEFTNKMVEKYRSNH